MKQSNFSILTKKFALYASGVIWDHRENGQLVEYKGQLAPFPVNVIKKIKWLFRLRGWLFIWFNTVSTSVNIAFILMFIQHIRLWYSEVVHVLCRYIYIYIYMINYIYIMYIGYLKLISHCSTVLIVIL